VVRPHDDDDGGIWGRLPHDGRGAARGVGADDPGYRPVLGDTATLTSFLVSGGRTSDIADQLERLAALHGDGRLTDAESRTAKAALFVRSSDAATARGTDAADHPARPD
jgi:hypothetical protein